MMFVLMVKNGDINNPLHDVDFLNKSKTYFATVWKILKEELESIRGTPIYHFTTVDSFVVDLLQR